MTTNPYAGLGRLSYDLGRLIDTPTQAAARRAEEAAQRPCPTCGALPGQRCITASGKVSRQPHAARFTE